MHIPRLMILGLAVLAACGPAMAQEPEIAPGTGWHEPQVTLLDVDFANSGFHARWEYFHCTCGDIMVRVEQSAPDGVLTGEMVLIDGQVLAARGMVAQAGDLELMLQAPTLMLQLAFGLLQRAIPGGPADVPIDQDIDVTENDIDVELNTGMANGRFAAPWRIQGRAWRGGPAKRRFRLNFEFALPDAPGQTSSIDFVGGQDYGGEAYPLHDATPLDGWRIQWLSKGETEPTDAPEELTLGDLRQQALELSQPSA